MRNLRSLVAAIFATTALVAASHGCTAKKPTELMIAVQTDVKVPKDLNAVTIKVISFGAVQFEETYEVGPAGLKLPATIGIVPKDPNDLKPVDIEITGRYSAGGDPAKGTTRVIRKSRVTFAKDLIALMRMPLRFACFDTDCPNPGESCQGGVCKPTQDVDGTTLPKLTAAQAASLATQATTPPTGGTAGACFDAEACLLSWQRINVASEDACVFDLGGGGGGDVDAGPKPEEDTSPPSSDDGGTGERDGGFGFKGLKGIDLSKPITVALAKPGPNGYGFCNGTDCKIPIDLDANEGWDYEGQAKNRIRLSPGLCAKLKLGYVVGATDACGSKTAEMPFCDRVSDLPPTGEDSGTPILPDATIEPPPDTSEPPFDSSVEDASAPLDSGPVLFTCELGSLVAGLTPVGSFSYDDGGDRGRNAFGGPSMKLFNMTYGAGGKSGCTGEGPRAYTITNGVDSYSEVDLPIGTSLERLVFSIWGTSTAPAPNVVLFSTIDGPSRGISVETNATGLGVFLKVRQASGFVQTSAITPSLGGWWRIVGDYDSKAGRARLWFDRGDGTAITSSTEVPVSGPLLTSNHLVSGRENYPTPGRYSKGSGGEARIYATASSVPPGDGGL